MGTFIWQIKVVVGNGCEKTNFADSAIGKGKNNIMNVTS